LLKLQRELKATVLYVTHDQTEALTMGDRVAVLYQGRLQQVAPPRELYDQPANRMVAGFIGSPAMNFFRAQLNHGANGLELVLGGQTLPLPEDFLETRPGLMPFQQKNLTVGIRPEHFTAPAAGQAATRLVLTIQVEVVETLGPVNYVHFSLPDLVTGQKPTPGVAALDPAVSVKPDQELEVAVDPQRLHFFDPDTGAAL